MGNTLLLPTDENRKLVHGFFDDFDSYVTAARWTALAADSGASVAQENVAGGSIALTTGGTDNNEAMAKTTSKTFLFANNKTLSGLFRIQYSEANTDDANLFIGYSSAAAANLMVDDGAGPAANHSAVGFCKVDGGTNWKAHVSLGTTQTTVELTAAALKAINMQAAGPIAAGGSSYQTLGVVVRAISATQAEAEFWFDSAGGVNLQLVYKIIFTYTSAVIMNGVLYIKAGGSNSEVLHADYADLKQQR